MVVTRNRDEELALFLQMRRREKEQSASPVAGSSSSNNSSGGSPPLKAVTLSVQPPRRTAAENFLYSENEKSDYDWLLTPPGTPQNPALEKQSLRSLRTTLEGINSRPTVLKSRLANFQEESLSRNNLSSRNPINGTGMNSSMMGLRRPSSSGGISSGRPSSSGGLRSSTRPSTPTGRPSIPLTATRSSSRPSTPTSRATLSSSAKSSRPSTPTSRATLPSSAKSSRPSAPTSRATLSSTKPTAPAPAIRSSTPTRSTARSSTPTASRPSIQNPKPVSRPSTPTRRVPTVSGRSSSVTRSAAPSTALNRQPPSRGTSPTVRSRPRKPSEMPDFSLDAPPNLRTSLTDRPTSASRGRPGAPSARSSSVDVGTNERARRQSRSPSRTRSMIGNGSAYVAPSIRGRALSKSVDNLSPVIIGTKMVERVVNMRKLAPSKQDTCNSTAKSSSSLDSSGFGRNISKKSLDMALRHMDIRRSVPGNLRPLMMNIPASSMYSVRSGSSRSRTASVPDSPLATCSNASSEQSVNNNFFSLDGLELDDTDLLSETSSYLNR